jgi:hydrogenase maturation protease
MTTHLILGYGNPDREDDGVGWRILERLAERLPGAAVAESPLDLPARDGAPDLLVALQLVPEFCETVARYDRVCFVDAHTGAYPDDVTIAPLEARYQSSPLTHHLTPQTLLSLAETAYGKRPQGLVISVRGYQFEFARSLSPETSKLADDAVERILEWIRE